MGNKIGSKRVFVPHGQRLGTQVELSIWSSTNIKSCIRKDWGIGFSGIGGLKDWFSSSLMVTVPLNYKYTFQF